MFIFSSRERLHLLWKLLGLEDFLINLHLICGVRPLSLKFQNHLNRAVWFQSKGLLRVSVIVKPLFPISNWDSNINPFLLPIFHWGEGGRERPLSQNYTFLSWDNLLYFYNCNRILFFADYVLTICLLNSCYDYKSFKIYYLWEREQLVFSVFRLKILFNGLYLLKCLSNNLRKCLPISILENLQKRGEVKTRLPFFSYALFF